MILRLNTPLNTRRTFTRVIRTFEKGEISEVKYKGIVYGISQLLALFWFESDIAIEERIEKIMEGCLRRAESLFRLIGCLSPRSGPAGVGKP